MFSDIFKPTSVAKSIYFPIDFPEKDAALSLAIEAKKNGIDFIELGMPYSDPLADGPTIQACSELALKNGATLHRYFEIAKDIKSKVAIEIVFMGYYNQILQFGFDRFAQACLDAGISHVIVPDCPVDEYERLYQNAALKFIFLVTPNTSEERIKKIDTMSQGFLYCVADNSITGAKSDISESQKAYFEKLQHLHLHNPLVAGFGISNQEQIKKLSPFVDGVIIGSAFLKSILEGGKESGISFLKSIKS